MKMVNTALLIIDVQLGNARASADSSLHRELTSIPTFALDSTAKCTLVV